MCEPKRRPSDTGNVVRLAVAVTVLAAITYAAYVVLAAVGPFVALAAWVSGLAAALSVAYVIREVIGGVIRERPPGAVPAGSLALPAVRARASLSEPLTGYVLSRAVREPASLHVAVRQAEPDRSRVESN